MVQVVSSCVGMQTEGEVEVILEVGAVMELEF